MNARFVGIGKNSRLVFRLQEDRPQPFAAIVTQRAKMHDALIEMDVHAARLHLPERPLQQMAPFCRKVRRISRLDGGANDLGDRLRAIMLLPVGARPFVGPHHLRPRRMPIDRQQAPSRVAWMQVQRFAGDAPLGCVQILDQTHAFRLEVVAPGFEVVAVDDVHITAIALAPLDIAAGRRVRLCRGNDFEESAAHGEQSIVQAVLADARIAETDFEAEHVLYLLLGCSEVAGDKTDLTKPEISHPAPSRSDCRAI